MKRRRAFSRVVSWLLLPLAGLFVVLRVMTAEHASIDPQAFPRYARPAGLGAADEKYLDWAGELTSWVIQVAKERWIRSGVVGYASAISALAITLAVAVNAPSWVPAALGFIAAAGQLIEGRNRDREQAHIGYQAAVALQKALRDFHTDAAGLSGQRLRERFAKFRREFERIKEEYGLEVLKVRGREPPQIG